MWPAPASLPALKLALDWPDDQIWARTERTWVALSPDGTASHTSPAPPTDRVRRSTSATCVAMRSDWCRRPEIPYNPFFSPDSAQIGFIANGKLGARRLRVVTPFEIGSIDANDRGVAWSTDGYIYSGGGSGIAHPESGGTREQITTLDIGRRGCTPVPSDVAGGRGVLFTIFKGPLEEARVWGRGS